ncbi:DUF5675 family protein [Sphingobacterium sp. xlx-130]|uniref:DUF5675 family protein n=1 Tax=Sphingobacterium sp. xlx-130 TaxID=2654323 RepID=UPI0013DA63B1|nr:DUF5675 family protein [Sphingobacterium sp. xlx-130]
MQIELKRIRKGKNSALSEIYIDGDFFCYGLEPLVCKVKVKGKTAIQAGVYRIGFNLDGGMNGEYKLKFPGLHRGMLEIKAIPNFSHVYIHIGNYFSETAGCPLLGDYFKLYAGDYTVYDSTKAYKRLYELVVEAVGKGIVVLRIG